MRAASRHDWFLARPSFLREGMEASKSSQDVSLAPQASSRTPSFYATPQGDTRTPKQQDGLEWVDTTCIHTRIFDTAYTPWGHMLWQAFIATRLNLPLPTFPHALLSGPQACPVRTASTRWTRGATITPRAPLSFMGVGNSFTTKCRTGSSFSSGRRVLRHHTTTSHSTTTELTATAAESKAI